jgi:hypothetical protein
VSVDSPRDGESGDAGMRSPSRRGSLILRYGAVEMLLLAASATLSEVAYSIDNRDMSLTLSGAAFVVSGLLVIVMIVMLIHVPARQRKNKLVNLK